MTCKAARLQMMDDLGHGASAALASHLASCGACASEWADLQAAFAAVAEGAGPQPPAGLADAVEQRIVADLSAPAPAKLELPFEGALSVVFGALAAFASLLLLHSQGLLARMLPLQLAAGSVAWAAVFILTFRILLRRWQSDPQLGHLVLGALSAAGLFLVGNHFLPLPAVAQWCSLHLGAGIGVVFFTVGIVYAAIPLLLFAASTSRRWRPRRRLVLVAGGLFFLLVAPAIFLHCAYFTAGALVAWLLGSIVGALAASAAGYWLGARAASA